MKVLASCLFSGACIDVEVLYTVHRLMCCDEFLELWMLRNCGWNFTTTMRARQERCSDAELWRDHVNRTPLLTEVGVPDLGYFYRYFKQNSAWLEIVNANSSQLVQYDYLDAYLYCFHADANVTQLLRKVYWWTTLRHQIEKELKIYHYI